MHKLNKELLTLVKQSFVPMPGGMAEPVAGASQMTAGMVAPMGGAPMDPSMGGGMPPGGDPSMGGMPPGAPMGGMPPGAPMDPAMGGMPPGAPMDPSMGGMPPGAPMDPSMGGMPPGDPAAAGGAPGQIVMSPEEFARVLQVVAGVGGGGGGGEAGAPPVGAGAKPKKVSTDAKLDALIQALGFQVPGEEGAAPGV